MAKRGENIRKRKDGRWEGRYIKGRKSNRTAIWGYIYGHSYTEVKEKLAIKKMEVQQFHTVHPSPCDTEAMPIPHFHKHLHHPYTTPEIRSRRWVA